MGHADAKADRLLIKPVAVFGPAPLKTSWTYPRQEQVVTDRQ